MGKLKTEMNAVCKALARDCGCHQETQSRDYQEVL